MLFKNLSLQLVCFICLTRKTFIDIMKDTKSINQFFYNKKRGLYEQILNIEIFLDTIF
nr:hypothetical protein [uncultured bacterium]